MILPGANKSMRLVYSIVPLFNCKSTTCIDNPPPPFLYVHLLFCILVEKLSSGVNILGHYGQRYCRARL